MDSGHKQNNSPASLGGVPFRWMVNTPWAKMETNTFHHNLVIYNQQKKKKKTTTTSQQQTLDQTQSSNIQIHKTKTTDVGWSQKIQYSNSQTQNQKNEQTSSVFHHHLCLFFDCLKRNWCISLKLTWKGWEQWDSGTVKEDHAAEGLPMGCLRVLHVMSTGPALASVRSSEAGSTMAEHTQCTGQFITVAEHTCNPHTVSVYCILIIITTHISLLLPYTHVSSLLPHNSTHDNPTTTDTSVYCFPKQDTRISLLLPYNNTHISLLLPYNMAPTTSVYCVPTTNMQTGASTKHQLHAQNLTKLWANLQAQPNQGNKNTNKAATNRHQKLHNSPKKRKTEDKKTLR